MPARPHDALFKATFSDPANARGELSSVLPAEVVARIDWSTLRLEAGTFVDASLRETMSDLLFSARLDRRRVRLHLLLEHQSALHALMPFRSLAYSVGVWERWRRAHPRARRLPPVIPVVLSHVEGGWTGPTDLLSIIDFGGRAERAAIAPLHPQCRILVDDLARLTHVALDARKMPAAAKLALAALRDVRRAKDPVQLIAAWARWIVAVRKGRRGAATLRTLARYIRRVRPLVDMKKMTAAVARIDRPAGKVFMTAEEELRREGRAEGKAEGKAEGEAKGKADMLLKLVRLRFTKRVPAKVTARIRRADAATLDRWAERVLSAKSLREVVAD